MSELKEALLAIMASRRFTEFFSGVEFKLDAQKSATFKIASCRPTQRAAGYRFTKYSIVTKIESSDGVEAYGFGENNFKILALQKSIAEAVERCVLKSMRRAGSDSKNSNGWAAHLSAKKAVTSAQAELFERDAALLHWLSATSLNEIPMDTWPKSLSKWAIDELSLAKKFNRLRILVSNLGIVPIVATIIQDENGHAFVSQSGAETLEKAIAKALAETCRIADLALSGVISKTSGVVKTPEDHALFYAFDEKLPEWVFGQCENFLQAQAAWVRKMANVNKQMPLLTNSTYQCGQLHIANSSSEEIQNLYFGSTEAAISNDWINFKRLEKICGWKRLNHLPHFVP